MKDEVLIGKLQIIDDQIHIIEIANLKDKKIIFCNKKTILNAIKNQKFFLWKFIFKINDQKNICKCAFNYFGDIVSFTLYDFEYNIQYVSKSILMIQYQIDKKTFIIPDEQHFKNMKEKYFVDHEENYAIVKKLKYAINKVIQGNKKYAFNFIFIDKFDNEIIAKVSCQLSKKKIINITFSDDTKQQLLLKKASQSEKIELLGEICGGIAHDFNNQLMIVEGSVGLLEKKIDEKYRIYTNNIKNSILQMSLLIKKLVTLSKTEVTLMEEVDLVEILEDVQKNIMYYSNKKFKIIFNNKIDQAIIKGNKTLIETSFLNILKNSYEAFERPDDNVIIISMEQVELKKMPNDSIVDIFTPGNYIKISVTDNGGGITPDKKNRIFDPFFTTKLDEKKSGLGLPTALGMVIQHQGIITVTSKVQVGTKMTIYFKAGENLEQLKFDLDSNKKKILIVDDEEVIRTILSDILTEGGYDVAAFTDGYEAINYFRRNSKLIDLVICDMIMPGINGKEVFYRIREINNNMKFLLLSGYSNEELDENFTNSINGFLSKPISIEVLEKTIDQIINM